MVGFTIGTDTEFFGKDKQGNHVALCGKIGGTKEAPLQLKDMSEGFCVQEDNVSVEWNVPPTSRKSVFVSYVKVMRERVAKILNTMELDISTAASVSFDKKELSHPNALVFGCEPDYDAWTKRENRKPHSDDECLRTAGGHIHVGTGEVGMLAGIRMMDLFLGVPSVLLDDSPESVKRRELYGKAGAMRPKPYGFEYRVLSNFWTFEDYLVKWVFDNTQLAMNKAVTGEVDKETAAKIQKCINTGDKELAQELIKEHDIPMPDKNAKEKEGKGMSFSEIIYKYPPLHNPQPGQIVNWTLDAAIEHFTIHGNNATMTIIDDIVADQEVPIPDTF